MSRDKAITEMLRRRDRMDAAQQDADDARSAFHQSLRRAYSLGVTMRELASALGMSHQRVHQLLGDDVALQVVRRLSETEPDEARRRVLRLVTPGDESPDAPVGEALARAADEAAALGHDHLGTEHVLLALLQRGRTADILGGMGVTYDDARSEVVTLLGEGSHKRPSDGLPATRALGRILSHMPTTTSELLAALLERTKDDDVAADDVGLVRCSFCGTSQRDCKKLIAGPGVYICDICIARASASRTSAERCKFCNKSSSKVKWLYEKARTTICDECIELCKDILESEKKS